MSLLAGTLLCALALASDGSEGASVPARDEPRVDTSLSAVCAVLARAPVRDERDALVLRRRLVALGSSAVPSVFHVLDLVCDSSAAAEGGAFASPRARALADALGDLPHDALTRHLEEIARGATRRRTRETALCLLADQGSGKDFELALELASAPSSAEAPGAAIAERALGTLLACDRGARRQAARAYERCTPEAATTLVSAASRAGGTASLELLLYWLGRRPALDAWILARASAIELDLPLSAEARGSLRRALARPESDVVALAARLAGRVGDDEAVEELLALLEHPDRDVRTGAHLGLCALSGLARRPDADDWRVWYELERTWWRESGARALDRVRQSDAAEVAALVEILARRKLFRREVALAMAEVLERDEPDLRRLACAGLAALRVAESRDALEPLLDDEDPGVRAAAATALAKLGPAARR